MVTLCTEINLRALFDKKGHSSSVQTVKGFWIVLGAMSRQHIKNISIWWNKNRKVKNYSLIGTHVKPPHNRCWLKNWRCAQYCTYAPDSIPKSVCHLWVKKNFFSLAIWIHIVVSAGKIACTSLSRQEVGNEQPWVYLLISRFTQSASSM